ncbi:hypothetical protein CAP39_01560 [Sphingomonas sp. IBVSS1]|nr:hypothetical protein CAP39_01560 [Sphingomonas sp. IBVSS1]
MNMPVRPAEDIQAEIAFRRASATAELLLVKGDIRALNRRVDALNEILEACNTASTAIQSATGPDEQDTMEGDDLRSHILLYVRKAGRIGVTTNQVNTYVKETVQRSFHPKTPLMTLSRLKNAGLVERTGKRWHSPN